MRPAVSSVDEHFGIDFVIPKLGESLGSIATTELSLQDCGIGLTAATAVSRLAWPERAATAAGEDAPGWRTYEVVMHAEVLDPAGPSRVWLPMPLTPDTDYHRSLGHAWTGNPARTRVYNETKYGAGIFCAEWPSGERAPIVDVTYRFATHDRAVDLTARDDAHGRTEDKRTLAKYLEPTRLIRTDGIVATTSGCLASPWASGWPAACRSSSIRA